MSQVLSRRVGGAALIAVCTALFASSAVAQDVGEKVRVTTAGGRIVGTVTNVDDGALTINIVGGGSRQLSPAEIAAIERSLGTRGHGRLGFLIGAGGGVAAAATFAFAVDDFGFGGDTAALAFAMGSLVWGGGLGLTGLLVGSFIKSERWDPIPTATIGGFSVSPVLGVGFGGRGQPRAPFVGGRIRF